MKLADGIENTKSLFVTLLALRNQVLLENNELGCKFVFEFGL